MNPSPVVAALDLHVRGIVQGVGFRPFVYRLARRYGLNGWVRNGASGVRIHVEGADGALAAFARALVDEAPVAAAIASVEETPGSGEGHDGFAIRPSEHTGTLSARIAPDMPVCEACVRELFDPADPRFRYPYITCTDCGPRYSIVTGVPYDRSATTMARWPMCASCRREYDDPENRRFHAQPLACPTCGPTYVLRRTERTDERRGWDAIEASAALLRAGAIVAIKGIGGFHLACDAANAATVEALRERKYRKERPFALMARDVAMARTLVELNDEGLALLTSRVRPVVIATARRTLPGVAPGNCELGMLLPYAPIHHLLFAAGAPGTIVMTSANRSGEPMAYRDADAVAILAGIADAFLIGERDIGRRLDDSVVRVAAFGTTVLRRARGMVPQAVASIPASRPILALGGDLKNVPALVVDGQVFAGPYVGDLEHLTCREALAESVRDLCAMYGVHQRDLIIAHDAHPEYASATFARSLAGTPVAVQHHRAHVASVLAERGAWETEAIGIAFDGTGYGDDGSIWGGEIFAGSIAGGFARVAHLRDAALPGGDAAARFPVQAAAGFLFDLDDVADLSCAPFHFPPRYRLARDMIAKNVRTFRSTSVGRLFDAVAALLGFTREITFEGQAAIWLEQSAAGGDDSCGPYDLPFRDGELDYRPVLAAILADRRRGCDAGAIARAFHTALAAAIVAVHAELGADRPLIASGGVFQNRLLVEMLDQQLGQRLWINRVVPPNDGGLALGQAAIAASIAAK